jgi:hypothetical protein
VARSTYHFLFTPMRIHWKILSLTESSIMLLEEHHKVVFSISTFNLGMSNGNLVGIANQIGSCMIGSFVRG